MKRLLLCLAASLVSLSAVAGDVNVGNLTTQGEFRQLTEDLGAALSYKPLTPAAPLGVTGFDVGLAVTVTQLKNGAVLSKAGAGDHSNLVVPTLRVNKGLPFDIDVGAMYAAVPGTDIRMWGGELRYALIAGNAALPAVGLRGSYTRLAGVSNLDFDTKGLDLSVSKGFAFFTPYAGVGRVWVSGTPSGNAALSKESFGLYKAFAGINMNFGLVNLAFEGDRTGPAMTYGMKVGVRF
ncbi:MAG TPA: hypothetical protein VF943_01120 [Burkholderiales bacterium]